MTFEPAPNAPAHKDVNPLLKLALELGPLIVFFFANARFDLFAATAAFMVATAIALAASWVLTRRLAIMPAVSAIVVAVFGTLTLVLHDETFIKMKPTIINALFGFILLGGLWFGRSLLGYVFDSVFALDDEGWRKLTFRWGLFFLFLAVANEVVWRTVSTDAWVSFKVFGIMPITLVFSLSQLPLLNRHAIERQPQQAPGE